jgi:hypothetical protein
VVPRHGGDDNGGWGGGGVVSGVKVKAEEERDGSVPGHGGEGRADGCDGDGMDPTVAMPKRAREILTA